MDTLNGDPSQGTQHSAKSHARLWDTPIDGWMGRHACPVTAQHSTLRHSRSLLQSRMRSSSSSSATGAVNRDAAAAPGTADCELAPDELCTSMHACVKSIWSVCVCVCVLACLCMRGNVLSLCGVCVWCEHMRAREGTRIGASKGAGHRDWPAVRAQHESHSHVTCLLQRCSNNSYQQLTTANNSLLQRCSWGTA